MSTSSVSSNNALTLFNRLNGLTETAQEFDTSISIYTRAARSLMGENPEHTFNHASEARRKKLYTFMESLNKAALSVLGPKEIEYYTAEFNRRAEHFDEETLSELRDEVKRISSEALTVFSNHKEHTNDAMWNIYQQSIPCIMGAANLVSRQVAFSNIVVNAKHKEEVRGSSKEDVEALIVRAKTALKLDTPKELISTDRIEEIERQFMLDAGRL